MKGFRSMLDSLLADRPKDADGRPLCECGAALVGDRFHCETCEAAHEQRRRREIVEQQRKELRARAERGVRTAPPWDVARVGSPEFERCVPIKSFRAAATKWTPAARSLTLIANTGDGKTTTAIRILWELTEKAIADCYAQKSSRPADFTARMLFASSFELVRARKEHPLGQGEAPLVERAMEATVLVLDDLGNEAPDTVIFEVVDRRYRNDLPTIVTTWLRPDAITERYGDALYRRLSERGVVLEATPA